MASWTDGKPTASASNVNAFVYFYGSSDQELAFTVQADVVQRTLTLYGGMSGGISVTADADIGNGAKSSAVFSSGQNSSLRIVVKFIAGNATTNLLVKFRITAGSGAILIAAATLE
jgi:hypothetical protein